MRLFTAIPPAVPTNPQTAMRTALAPPRLNARGSDSCRREDTMASRWLHDLGDRSKTPVSYLPMLAAGRVSVSSLHWRAPRADAVPARRSIHHGPC